ncbi:MAG: hypothetical protein WCL23_05445 [Candidatus Moraniibacteriota bacterium]
MMAVSINDSMHEISITPITKKIVVRYDGGHVSLPADLLSGIEVYWEELLRSGRPYTRGETFTVTGRNDTDERIEISVTRTDFAHNLYCRRFPVPDGYAARVIHTAALVETSDGKVVFGRMSGHTSHSGRYQLCGGGLDNNDLHGDILDLDHNTKKELREEFGIDVDDTNRVGSFFPAYFKEGGQRGRMSVIYRVALKETAGEFLNRYDVFDDGLRKSGEEPEFDEIVVFNRNSKELLSFLARENLRFEEYMRPLFEYIASDQTLK